MRHRTQQTTTRPWVLLVFLAALVTIWATAFSAVTASATTTAGAETRVRVSAQNFTVAVAASDRITTGQQLEKVLAGPGIVVATGVAAKPAIGFADDAVGSAYQGMRSGGGHAIRHLRDEGLISNSGSLASQVSQFENLTSPILRSPSATFDWRLGNTLTRAFAGEAGGRQVVVFVAKEGSYQGRVLSAVVPDASQMAQWGLP